MNDISVIHNDITLNRNLQFKPDAQLLMQRTYDIQHWCSTRLRCGTPKLEFEPHPQRGVLKVVIKFGL